MIHQWPVLWFLVSLLGIAGLGLALLGLVLLAYAAFSHLRPSEKKVAWRWNSGIAWFAVRLFAGGLLLQVIAFACRIALGGS